MVSLTHVKVSTIPDSGDPTIIQPSDWNSQHLLTCSSNILLGRTTAGTGAIEELTVGSGLTLSSGVLSASGGSGSVTTVSVVTANGLSGSVANPTTTPAITLSTTISGILKGNGSSLSAATAGTDYQSPIGTITGLAKGNGANALTSATAGVDYVAPSVLGAANGVATLDSGGKLTSSQIPDIAIVTYLGAVASQSAMLALTGQQGDWCTRTDLGTNWVITGSTPSSLSSWTQLSYPTAPVTSVNSKTGAVTLSASDVGAQSSVTVNGIVKGNGSGTLSAAVSGTDYAPATSGSSILKGNAAGGFASAVAKTDYAPATSGSGILKGDGLGGFATATSGTDYQSPIGTISGLAKGNGANALTAAVSGTDYAPATSGSSILKGNGAGGFSSASAGTDYAIPTSGTSILYGNGSGGFSNVTVGSGLSFAGGTLNNSGAMTYPGAGMAVSTGSAWGTSKATPTGDVVGTSDTQTLTNKTLTAAGSNTVEATSGPTSTQLAGNRNKIINGAMMIDQRNAGAAFGTSINGYSLDRWVVQTSATGKLNGGQNYNSITPPVGFSNYLGIVSQSAYTVGVNDYFDIYQIIEGYNISDLAWGTSSAKSVTLSFRVYSSLTGTFGGSIRNGSYSRSYPFTYSISSANTWTTISLTIPGDTSGTWLTNNGAGLLITLSLGMGSTYSGTAGSWASGSYASATGATSVVGTNGATFYITGVQLEKGSTATPFENRLYGTELALCQRYYTKIPGEYVGGNCYYADASNAYWAVTRIFPVTMRATPTYQCSTASVNLVGGITASNVYALQSSANGLILMQYTPNPSGSALAGLPLSLTAQLSAEL